MRLLGLPKSTELSKPLPKTVLYAKFSLSAAERARVDADISRMVIVHEVSHARLNIAAGEEVSVFFVLHVFLKCKNFDQRVISMLFKLIPQHLVMILEFEGEVRLAVFRGHLFLSGWQKVSGLSLELSGLDMDKVWDGVVMQVGSISVSDGRGLDDQIAEDERRQKTLKEIEILEKKARAESQPRRKFELVLKIKRLQALIK